MLNDKGLVDEEQYRIIANAFNAWSGTKLEAFIICFRPKSVPVNWSVAFGALEAVAYRLKAQGAKIVIMPPGGLCDASALRSTLYGSHVEIMGVVHF